MLYRMRYYHPALGRFVTRDPIGYEAGDANLFRYVENNIKNHVDHLGLQSMGGVDLGRFLGDQFYGPAPPMPPNWGNQGGGIGGNSIICRPPDDCDKKHKDELASIARTHRYCLYLVTLGSNTSGAAGQPGKTLIGKALKYGRRGAAKVTAKALLACMTAELVSMEAADLRLKICQETGRWI